MIGVIVVIVLVVIFMRGDQLEELIDTIKKGTPIFLILAVCAQLCKYFSQGAAFKSCFYAVDEKIPYFEGLKLVFGTFFVNTLAPSLNLAGTALVVGDASKRNIPAGRATSAALFMQLTIDTGFVVIMLITFTILTFTIGLQPGWFLVGLVAVVLVGGLAAVIILGGTKPKFMLKILLPIERLINKLLGLIKRDPLKPWANQLISSFSQAFKLLTKNPFRALKSFGFSIIASICELMCFSLCSFSFGVFSLEACVCGYVVATLFAMISITPQGIGVVEAASLVAFTLFGINQAAGMAIILVYRGIVFWLPFLIGAVVIQRTKAFKEIGKKQDNNKESDDLHKDA